tara:strand:- start:11905 stop:14043 length:2139 start_codon:yes stop_codon:yes gene_type:complete
MSVGKRTINPTIVPGLPKVPSDLSPQAKRYLEMLTEAVEIRLGRRGDPRDAAITFRDLLDAGLATEGALVFNSSTGFSGTSIVPTGGPTNSTIPTAPTGFQANGAYSKIILQWDYPFDQFYGYSITEVFRHTADVLGDAQLVGSATGMIFVDEVGESASYYYWVRHVNDNGIAGPFNSNTGTFAQTATDVNFMLELLTDAITEDEFAQSLKTEIDLIQVIVTQLYGSGSTGNPAVGSIMYDVNTLQSTIGTVTNDVSNLTTVTGNHTSQISALNNTLNDPNTGLAATSNVLQGVQTNVTNLGTTVGANSSDITLLKNTVNDPNTGLAAQSTALSGLSSSVTTNGATISSQGQDISALQTQVNDPATGLSASSTAITNLQATTSQHGQDISNNAALTNTLNSTVGGHTASFQQQALTNANLSGDIADLNAEYSVKVDVNGNVAGFGLASGGSPQQSRFYVAADKFAIVPSGAPSTSNSTVPFVVVTSPTTQNGVTVPAGTYIHSAMIANGTIANAQIGNLAVDSAQIADLAVETAKIDNFAITGAKIALATITTANIEDATITTADIGLAQITTLILDQEAVIVPRFAQGTVYNVTLTGSATQVVGVPISISGLPSNQSCRIVVMGVISAYPGNNTVTNLRAHIYSGSTQHNTIGVSYTDYGLSLATFGSFLVSNGYSQTISLRVSCTANPSGSSTKSNNTFLGKIIVMAAKR